MGERHHFSTQHSLQYALAVLRRVCWTQVGIMKGWLDAVDRATGCWLVVCALEHEGVGSCGSLGMQKLVGNLVWVKETLMPSESSTLS